MSTELALAVIETHEEAKLKALTDQLIEIAEKAPSHQLMLVALLSTYRAIAVTHPCCTKFAAEVALQMGGRLLINALEGVPAGTPVH